MIASIPTAGKFPDDILEADDELPLQDAFHIPKDYRKVLLANTLRRSSTVKKESVLGGYYKFTMYRHPAERLLSGYRSKIEGYPLHEGGANSPFKRVILQIFKFTQLQKYNKWSASGHKEVIHIKFSEFIQYWIHKRTTNNDHFQLIYDVCKPCKIRYDYYGNFKDFNRDAEVLLKHQGGNLTLLGESYYEGSGKTTREIAPEYYRQLSNQQKQRVLGILALDLRFYYNLFPEENGTHKTIMDTDYDVPIPTT